MLTVCSFFWIDPARRRDYSITPDSIRIWKNMVDRNLTVPHRTVCITHRPDLVEDFIETVPLDYSKHVPGTCTIKLMVWREGIEKVLGDRILLMDVDCVITGNMDSLVDRDEKAVWWLNPNYEKGGKRGRIQGSMQLFTAGAHPELYNDFDPEKTPLWLNRRFGGAEQCWISERLNTSYPEPGWDWDISCWGASDGVYGFGRIFQGKMDKGVHDDLPSNAKIIFTPGNRSPENLMSTHPWIKDYYY